MFKQIVVFYIFFIGFSFVHASEFSQSPGHKLAKGDVEILFNVAKSTGYEFDFARGAVEGVIENDSINDVLPVLGKFTGELDQEVIKLGFSYQPFENISVFGLIGNGKQDQNGSLSSDDMSTNTIGFKFTSNSDEKINYAISVSSSFGDSEFTSQIPGDIFVFRTDLNDVIPFSQLDVSEKIEMRTSVVSFTLARKFNNITSYVGVDLEDVSGEYSTVFSKENALVGLCPSGGGSCPEVVRDIDVTIERDFQNSKMLGFLVGINGQIDKRLSWGAEIHDGRDSAAIVGLAYHLF